MIGEEWKQCKKKVIAHVRAVKGIKERVDTREGITWAYTDTDYVMCGPDEDGNPDLSDVYPIKKNRFQETYELIEEE